MIKNELVDEYFEHLIHARRKDCFDIVDSLLENKIPVETIYTELFQRSLYKVGEYWEKNLISVATEHMATALTENMMIRLQPKIFNIERIGKKAVIACVANEYHQVGAKMIADIFEMYGWDGYFVGANTPFDAMISFIESHKPDTIGLSLSIYYNLPELKITLEKINGKFPETPVIVGGQAFRWGGIDIVQQYHNVDFIPSINSLKNYINKNN
ncbi:MAG: cobalamin-binding protein [Sphingobacteriia bacterium]|nr:cobalamin-binding protein [Sphingobacteriia bacterium]